VGAGGASEWALVEEDIKVRRLFWLKAEKRVTAKRFIKWPNGVIFKEQSIAKELGDGHTSSIVRLVR
jgi:hypothetical protein